MLRDVDRLRAVFTWTHGGNLASSSWGDVGRALPYALSGACVLYALARGLDALQLGDDTARTLGVDERTVRIGVILGASLATAAAVAFVGSSVSWVWSARTSCVASERRLTACSCRRRPSRCAASVRDDADGVGGPNDRAGAESARTRARLRRRPTPAGARGEPAFRCDA